MFSGNQLIDPDTSRRSARKHSQPKKGFIRRNGQDHSQNTRHLFQILFVILNLWIGMEFYRFTVSFELAALHSSAGRPPGVEGWLPIAALMNLRYLIFSGHFPTIHPAGLVLLLTFIVISWVWGKSFCSWLCPIGTLSEGLWKLGRRITKRTLSLPGGLDLPLRGLKYLLLGLFIFAIGSMSNQAIESFLGGPYGLIADVKMLNFFRHLSPTAAWVLTLLVLASLFIQNFWCRYLCPYGALLAFPALLSPGKIRRQAETCIDCGKCAKACPALLPVDQLKVVRSAECTSCLECVAVCPVKDTLDLTFTSRRKIPAWIMAATLAGIFLLAIGIAKWTGHWNSPIPDSVYQRLIPQADHFSHP
jgi:polyferredoxin